MPVVVDPVGVSKHGDPLVDEDARAVMSNALLPLATVITPNLHEAGWLTGLGRERRRRPSWRSTCSRYGSGLGVDQGRPRRPARSGRLPPLGRRGRAPLRRRPAPNRHTHGTGCTLASALACGLAPGLGVPEATEAAKRYVTGAIAAGFPLGAGIGPTDHFWAHAPGAGPDPPGTPYTGSR